MPEEPAQPVFVDPSGKRRVLIWISSTAVAAASVAFIAGAGMLLSGQPASTAPPLFGELGIDQPATPDASVAGTAVPPPSPLPSKGNRVVVAPVTTHSGVPPAAQSNVQASPGVPTSAAPAVAAPPPVVVAPPVEPVPLESPVVEPPPPVVSEPPPPPPPVTSEPPPPPPPPVTSDPPTSVAPPTSP